jgi:regulatory protein
VALAQRGRGPARHPREPDPDLDAGRAPQDADDQPDADPVEVARTICLRMLEQQPRTRAELATALRKRAVPDAAAEAVLDRFGEVGLVDDEAYAAAWVASRQRGRGLARRALADELRRKGVDAGIVREAVAEVSADDEAAAARVLVERRLPAMRRLTPEVRTRRLVSMLARKGYPAGLAYAVVRDLVGADLLDHLDE